jgi:hypothetical protein
LWGSGDVADRQIASSGGLDNDTTMFDLTAKLQALALWSGTLRILGLVPPDDPRNRPRAAPAPWPLRKPALVGHWRARIGGGVEWCWDVADRSATILPFASTRPRVQSASTVKDTSRSP